MHLYFSVFNNAGGQGHGEEYTYNAYSSYKTDNNNNEEIEVWDGRIRVEIFTVTLVRK